MGKLDHPRLRFDPFPETKWGVDDRPVLIVDGKVYRIKTLTHRVSGAAGYVVGVSDKEFPKLANLLDVELLQFYELRVSDLTPLSKINRLRHLTVRWNTKLTDLREIGRLSNLESLLLIDTPKVRDLSPLQNLVELRALEYSGGIWNRNVATTLEPISQLKKLEELELTNLRVEDGGLRPLAKCQNLQALGVSNQFDTEDYAFLSVVLPQVKCRAFAPWVAVNHTNGIDTMIVGKRKPFLNSKTDAQKIANYEAAFRKLQDRFAARLHT
ncbi:MAG: leucine-rich repeat domain-containing protein [Burkholderiales bacterium]